MRVVVVWREESDYGREMRDWIRDFESRSGVSPESVNPDEQNGISLCKAYDIVEYPSILALADNGSMLHMWRGKPLPRIDDVSYYTIS